MLAFLTRHPLGRALSLGVTFFAVVATSKVMPHECNVGDGSCCGAGDPKPKSQSVYGGAAIHDDCDETGRVLLGVPTELTREDLATLGGVYVYFDLLDTFGVLPVTELPDLADPFLVDVYADADLATGIAQPRLRLNWPVPVRHGPDEPVTKDVTPSGLVYLPLTPELKTLLTQKVAELENAMDAHLKLKFALTLKTGESKYGEATLSIASRGLPPTGEPPAPAGRTDEAYLTDALVASRALVANRYQQPQAPDTPDDRTFVALYFSGKLDPKADLGTLVRVKQYNTGEPVDAAWTLGQDGRALIGSFYHQGEPISIELAKELKTVDGKGVLGGSNAALSNGGIEVKAEEVTE